MRIENSRPLAALWILLAFVGSCSRPNEHIPWSGQGDGAVRGGDGEDVGVEAGVAPDTGSPPDASPPSDAAAIADATARDGGDATSGGDRDAMTADAATCRDGETERRPCGACGQQDGVCANGQWVWGPCGAETGECVPGASRQTACGRCGSGAETCTSACTWQATSCAGEGTCWAGEGEVATSGCAPGERSTRVCSAICEWSVWSACSAVPNGWRPMMRGPLAGRTQAQAAWSGREVLIWGGIGGDIYDDGAAYDPATDSWRPLPPAPLRARYDGASAWTGNRFFVWGGYGPMTDPDDHGSPAVPGPRDDGALFDPSTQGWTRVSPAPLSARSRPSAVWSAATREVIIWGGVGAGGSAGGVLADGAAFNPSTGTWRLLAPFPLGDRWNQTAVWTGSRMMILGGYYVSGGVTHARNDAAEYDPAADSWSITATAASGLGARALVGAGADGNRVAFLGGQDNNHFFADGAIYDGLTMVWSALRAPTAAELRSAARRDPFVWWHASRIFAWGGFSSAVGHAMDGASYDVSTDAWTSIPPAFTAEHRVPLRVWTGSDLVVWSGADAVGYFADGKVFRP